MNILEEIAEKTTERIRKEKEEIPLSTVRPLLKKDARSSRIFSLKRR